MSPDLVVHFERTAYRRFIAAVRPSGALPMDVAVTVMRRPAPTYEL